MSKHYARAVSLKIDEEDYIGLEIPQEIIDALELRDGEVLEANVDGNSLVFKKTGIVDNGH